MFAENKIKGSESYTDCLGISTSEVPNIVPEVVTKTILKKNKKEKWLSEEVLQITKKRRQVKGKGESGRYTQLNAEFQRISSVQFSQSVVSDSLWPHGLQHARPPCSAPTPKVYPNSCPLNQWCHSTISSSVVPFSCLESFPASWSFPMSQFFASGGQVAKVLEFQLQHQSL